jgi:4-amino-4-deoxy-L-arabinose transferase-like glycosyltransferase
VHRAGTRRALAAFWVLTAFGLALKGPITLLFTLLPAIIWRAVADGWAGVRALRPLAGIAALTGVVALWGAGVIAAGHEDYLLDIWRRQLVGRAIDSWSHKEPVYFYLVLLPLLVMPWTALVVDGARRLYRERPSYATVVAIFTLVPFVGISILSGKLFIYLLPLLPGVAILAAASVERLSGDTARVSGWLAWPPVVYVLFTAAVVGYIDWHYLPGHPPAAAALAAGLAVLAATGIWLARQPAPRWLRGWVGLAVVHSWLLFAGLGSLVDPLFSGRALGEAVARHAGPDTEVGVIHGTRGILNYYAGRKMTEVRREEAAQWVAAHPNALAILKKNEIGVTFGPGGIPAGCRIHEVFYLELKEFHVISACL